MLQYNNTALTDILGSMTAQAQATLRISKQVQECPYNTAIQLLQIYQLRSGKAQAQISLKFYNQWRNNTAIQPLTEILGY
jgi:hypothetical protein